LLVADPEHVVVLPAELAPGTTPANSQDWSILMPGASASSGGNAAAGFAPAGDHGPDSPALLLLLLAALVAAGLAIVAARRAALMRRLAPDPPDAPDELDSGDRGSLSESA
jgi:hypothetical protein